MDGSNEMANFARLILEFSSYKTVGKVVLSFEGTSDISDFLEKDLEFLDLLSRASQRRAGEDDVMTLQFRIVLARLCRRLRAVLDEKVSQEEQERMWVNVLRCFEPIADFSAVDPKSDMFVLLAKLNRCLHTQYIWHLVEAQCYKKAGDIARNYEDMMPGGEQSPTLAMLQKMLKRQPGSEMWTQYHSRLAPKLTQDAFLKNVCPLLRQLNNYYGVPSIIRRLQGALPADPQIHPSTALLRVIDYLISPEVNTDEDHERHERVESEVEERFDGQPHWNSQSRERRKCTSASQPRHNLRGRTAERAANHSEPLVQDEDQEEHSVSDKDGGASSTADSDQRSMSSPSRRPVLKRSAYAFSASDNDESGENQSSPKSPTKPTPERKRVYRLRRSACPLGSRLLTRMATNGVAQTWSSEEESDGDNRKKFSVQKHRVAQMLKQRRFKWSEKEIAALKDGVAIHGEGNWAAIHSEKKDVLKGRRPVDLKDKWRNLKRNGDV